MTTNHHMPQSQRKIEKNVIKNTFFFSLIWNTKDVWFSDLFVTATWTENLPTWNLSVSISEKLKEKKCIYILSFEASGYHFSSMAVYLQLIGTSMTTNCQPMNNKPNISLRNHKIQRSKVHTLRNQSNFLWTKLRKRNETRHLNS